MSEVSTNLALPFLRQAQAQKHVTVNESLLRLDATVQTRTLSRTITVQPGAPADGALYILPPGKSGADWGAMANNALAYFRDGVWEQITPRAGWSAFVIDEAGHVFFTGAEWAPLSASHAPARTPRNALINGAFSIWQRGGSFTAAGYCADRWRLDLAGGSASVTRQSFALGQTDTPGEPASFARVAATGGAGASDYVVLRQRIEHVRTFAGAQATLSFYAKRSAGAGNVAVELAQIFGTGGSPSASVTAIGAAIVAIGASWARYSVTIDAPSVSGKTLGSNDDDYLELNFWLSAGASLDARTASLGAQTVTIDFALAQMEGGAHASPFEAHPEAVDLAECQRFFEKSFRLAYAPAQNAGVNTGEAVWSAATAGATGQRNEVRFARPKRQVPTIALYNPSAANAQIRDQSVNADFTGSVAFNVTESGLALFGTGAAGTAVGNRVGVHWTADAEL